MQTSASALSEPVESADTVPAKTTSGQVEPKSQAEKSVSARVSELVKLVTAAYGIGFAVIMVHTIRLNGPVIEALQFQNIIAGLPIWAVVFGGIWLWPTLTRAIVKESKGKALAGRSFIYFILLTLVGLWLVYRFYQFFVGKVNLGRTLSRSEDVFLFFIIAFLLMLSMLFSAYQRPGQLQMKAILRLAVAYSGLAMTIVGYAIFVYPILPQSYGGGKPRPVKLYFKDKDVAAGLGDPASQVAQPELSAQVYLYYRTSSFLLVSKAKGQPLIEVPMDQVRAVVWLDSRAE